MLFFQRTQMAYISVEDVRFDLTTNIPLTLPLSAHVLAFFQSLSAGLAENWKSCKVSTKLVSKPNNKRKLQDAKL